MPEQRVSYRYAKAIFDSVLQEKLEERVYNDFMVVLQILKYAPELFKVSLASRSSRQFERRNCIKKFLLKKFRRKL